MARHCVAVLVMFLSCSPIIFNCSSSLRLTVSYSGLWLGLYLPAALSGFSTVRISSSFERAHTQLLPSTVRRLLLLFCIRGTGILSRFRLASSVLQFSPRIYPRLCQSLSLSAIFSLRIILFAVLYTSCTVLLSRASTEHLCHCALNKPRPSECPLPQSYVTGLPEPA